MIHKTPSAHRVGFFRGSGSPILGDERTRPMPLDKFVLILVCVIAAAGATVWLGVMLTAAIQIPFGWLVLIPAALIGYIVFRVIAERVGNAEEDHYDKMDH